MPTPTPRAARRRRNRPDPTTRYAITAKGHALLRADAERRGALTAEAAARASHAAMAHLRAVKDAIIVASWQKRRAARNR